MSVMQEGRAQQELLSLVLTMIENTS